MFSMRSSITRMSPSFWRFVWTLVNLWEIICPKRLSMVLWSLFPSRLNWWIVLNNVAVDAMLNMIRHFCNFFSVILICWLNMNWRDDVVHLTFAFSIWILQMLNRDFIRFISEEEDLLLLCLSGQPGMVYLLKNTVLLIIYFCEPCIYNIYLKHEYTKGSLKVSGAFCIWMATKIPRLCAMPVPCL